MKKQTKFIYAALAAVMVSACSKADSDQIGSEPQSGSTYTVTLNSPDASKLATAYDDASSSWGNTWESGDKILAWSVDGAFASDGITPTSSSFVMTLTEGDGTTAATFTGTKPDAFVTGDPTYFVYPSTASTGEVVQITMTQQSFDASNPDAAWPGNMRMVANATDKSFNYFSALFNLNLSLTNATADTKISKVEVTGTNLVSDASRYIDWPDNTDRANFGWGSNKVTSINVSNLTLAAGDNSQTIKFVLAEFDLCDLTFTITVNEGDTKSHVYSVTKDIMTSYTGEETKFANGKFHTLSLDVNLTADEANEDFVATVEKYTFEGDGTEDSPYLINDLTDFEGLVSDTSADVDGVLNHNGNYFRLENSITLASTTGVVGGTSSAWATFYGIFDGNGKTITTTNNNPVFGIIGENGVVKNLIVNNERGADGSTQFSCGSGALIQQNCGVVDNCVTTGALYKSGGFFAGMVKENRGFIVNCVNRIDMSVSTLGGGAYGGIVGAMGTTVENSVYYYGKVINCANLGSMTGDNQLAGIAGRLYKANYIYLFNSYSNCSLISLNGAPTNVGFAVDNSSIKSTYVYYKGYTSNFGTATNYDSSIATNLADSTDTSIKTLLTANVAKYNATDYSTYYAELPTGTTLNDWRIDGNGNVVPTTTLMGDVEAPEVVGTLVPAPVAD